MKKKRISLQSSRSTKDNIVRSVEPMKVSLGEIVLAAKGEGLEAQANPYLADLIRGQK